MRRLYSAPKWLTFPIRQHYQKISHLWAICFSMGRLRTCLSSSPIIKIYFPIYIQSFVVLHLIAFFHSQLTSWYCFGKRVLRIEFTLWVCATGLAYDRPAHVPLNTCSKPGPLASCSVSLCFLAANSSPQWVDFSLLSTISLQGSSLTAEFRHFARLICQWIPSHTFSRLGLPCVPNSLLGFLRSLLHLRHSILRFIVPLSALVHRTIII